MFIGQAFGWTRRGAFAKSDRTARTICAGQAGASGRRKADKRPYVQKFRDSWRHSDHGGRRKPALEIEIVFKIAAVGIIVAVLNQVLSRAGREDQAMMTTLAGLIVVLFWVVQYINELFTMIQSMFNL